MAVASLSGLDIYAVPRYGHGALNVGAVVRNLWFSVKRAGRLSTWELLH